MFIFCKDSWGLLRRNKTGPGSGTSAEPGKRETYVQRPAQRGRAPQLLCGRRWPGPQIWGFWGLGKTSQDNTGHMPNASVVYNSPQQRGFSEEGKSKLCSSGNPQEPRLGLSMSPFWCHSLLFWTKPELTMKCLTNRLNSQPYLVYIPSKEMVP